VFAVLALFLAPLAVFLFLALVLSHFFLGHLIILARGKHGATPRVPAGTEFASGSFFDPQASHGADRLLDGTGFDQEIAYFLEKFVQVVWLQRVGQAVPLKNRLRRGRMSQRDQKKDAEFLARMRNAILARSRGGAGQFAQDGKQRPLQTAHRYIDDGKIPAAGRKFAERLARIGNNAHTPTFGIEHAFERMLAGNVVVNDQNADFAQIAPPLNGKNKYMCSRLRMDGASLPQVPRRACPKVQANIRRIASKRRDCLQCTLRLALCFEVLHYF
jgi:hypothetical protein